MAEYFDKDGESGLDTLSTVSENHNVSNPAATYPVAVYQGLSQEAINSGCQPMGGQAGGVPSGLVLEVIVAKIAGGTAT